MGQEELILWKHVITWAGILLVTITLCITTWNVVDRTAPLRTYNTTLSK